MSNTGGGLVRLGGFEEEMCPQPMKARAPGRMPPAARPAGATQRSQAKENRRQALLAAAASLFAVTGSKVFPSRTSERRQESADPPSTGIFPASRPSWRTCWYRQPGASGRRAEGGGNT